VYVYIRPCVCVRLYVCLCFLCTTVVFPPSPVPTKTAFTFTSGNEELECKNVFIVTLFDCDDVLLGTAAGDASDGCG
jgi:hypothetical protein